MFEREYPFTVYYVEKDKRTGEECEVVDGIKTLTLDEAIDELRASGEGRLYKEIENDYISLTYKKPYVDGVADWIVLVWMADGEEE